MSEIAAIRLDTFGNADPSEVVDAIDLASDQDQPTWIFDNAGGKVAAIVPVEVLEYYEQMLAGVLRPSFAGKPRGGVSE